MYILLYPDEGNENEINNNSDLFFTFISIKLMSVLWNAVIPHPSITGALMPKGPCPQNHVWS